jgi:ribosomal protein L14E/L6E/L27E
LSPDETDGVPVVSSLTGRDKDRKYVIVCKDESFVYLSDGKFRSLDRTKKKRGKHVRLAGSIPREHAVWLEEKPKRPIEVRNSELRKALATWDREHSLEGEKNAKRRRN